MWIWRTTEDDPPLALSARSYSALAGPVLWPIPRFAGGAGGQIRAKNPQSRCRGQSHGMSTALSIK